MWKQGEGQNIDNLDNYLSAIEKSKQDLATIGEEIKTALASRDEIISTSHALLREKLESIEHDKKNVEAMRSMAMELKDKNDITLADLEQKYVDFLNEKKSFDFDKSDFAHTVQSKSVEFESREQDIARSLLDISAKNKELERTVRSNEELLNSITNEKKIVQDNLSKYMEMKDIAEKHNDDSNKKIMECKKLREETQIIRDQSEKNNSSAQQALEESRINKMQNEENLANILKEKEAINNLIIESKKLKLEAIKSIEISQRLIAESNLKLAELRDLKEAMAKA